MSTTAPFSPLSTPAATWLVAKREIRARLRSRAFLVSTAILLLIVLASVVVGSIVSSTSGPTKVAVVEGAVSSAVLEKAHGFDVRDVPDAAAAEKLVRAGTVDAALVPDDSTQLGFEVVGLSSPPAEVVAAFSEQPPVHVLSPPKGNGLLRYLVALAFGIVFFMAAMTFGQLIAQSVVEEKATRIVEILLAAIPARALLAGKVIGASILAFAQIALFAIVALGGLAVTGQTALVSSLGAPILWFVVFFVFGFVLIATLFAATGALVSRQEDAASTTTPVTMLVMLPYLLIIVLNSNDTAVAIMSYIPFSAPIGMPLRLFLGTAQWWEPLIALVLLLATTALVLQLGARIYENALLRLGTRVPWRQAFRSAR
jgi:ABC-2 type transport system permease protein